MYEWKEFCVCGKRPMKRVVYIEVSEVWMVWGREWLAATLMPKEIDVQMQRVLCLRKEKRPTKRNLDV